MHAPKQRQRNVEAGSKPPSVVPFGQVVLVFQGGGALGAYQLGVYQALHEAGIEPDWVIGTSIGAINGAIIAGNPPDKRMERLHAFWDRMEQKPPAWAGQFANALTNALTFTQGLPGFFEPNRLASLGQRTKLGIEQASYYSTEPLRKTLTALVDVDYLASKATRLTVGAVNARSGEMRYFDSRDEPLNILHVMASGALPPAFPAVRIDGEPYWDGGIYSNTPFEVVLDDRARRDSTVFSVHLWHPDGPEPESLWDVGCRQKDVQFSSRANSHLLRHQQIHRLRHIIRELGRALPDEVRQQAEFKELCSWGCGTTMHLVRLTVPRIKGEDQTKDVDFTASGIHVRWQAGYADTCKAIAAAPWQRPVDPREGVLIHDVN